MSEKLKDILSHLSTEVDQETLLKYLEGRLSDEQKHELEKRMLNSEFTDDAMERHKESVVALFHHEPHLVTLAV